MFENSPDETKTQTERDFNIGFFKQIGDIGLIVRWILFAVFFTLLLVVGNTMAQSVRERVPELAILKTLGFSDGSVLGFVLAEALLICVIGGLAGMGIATFLGSLAGRGGNFPLRGRRRRLAHGPRRDAADEHRGGIAAGTARAAPEDRRCAGGTLKP